MKVTFIGTGTMGSMTRGNQSLVIDEILFDIGCGTVKKMESLKIYTKDIKCLVISHFHADHFFDLPNYLIGRNIRNEHLKETLPIIGGKGLKKRVIELFTLAFGDGNKEKYSNFERDFNVKFVELENTKEYIDVDNSFSIKAHDLIHGACKPILGFILNKENKKIGYVTDTILCDNLKEICRECDTVFIDATNTIPTGMHIGLNEVLELKKENENTNFFAIHRSDYIHSHIKEINFPEDEECIII